MRRPILLVLVLALFAPACSFEPFDGTFGDSTDGDRGRSRWSLSDGLCPGFGLCALDVAVATGASTRLVVVVPDRVVAELSPLVLSGAATIGEVTRAPESDELRFELHVTGPGIIELAIVNPDGERVDTARFEARAPEGLECGVLAAGAQVRYPMVSMSEGVREVTLRSSDTEGVPELGCRVTDASGAPLLSVDIVAWRIVREPDEDPLIAVRSHPFELVADVVHGARVYVHPLDTERTGTATLEASLGASAQTFTVHVVE